ncbi:unnamed protein product [Mycena citricolor]|uniref:Uncharacterized protein n=1 Tax=Mycena citricolor TaxID=2018698 RepID=A0AAD2HJ19_9AGAR|nr:unnamed protein product [Mycena citricolor]CAK5275866.1 unnamed protein product [Mycena citricolor]
MENINTSLQMSCSQHHNLMSTVHNWRDRFRPRTCFVERDGGVQLFTPRSIPARSQSKPTSSTIPEAQSRLPALQKSNWADDNSFTSAVRPIRYN